MGIEIYLDDPTVLIVNTGEIVRCTDIQWQPLYDADFTDITPSQLNDKYCFVETVEDDHVFYYLIFMIQTPLNLVDIYFTNFRKYQSGGQIRKCVNAVHGLNHLESQEVVVLADGNVIDGLEVWDGCIFFNKFEFYSQIHVGLRYIPEIETMNLEAPDRTIQGKVKNITDAKVMYARSRGTLIAPVFEDDQQIKVGDFEELVQRSFNEPQDQPIQLYTGFLDLSVNDTYNEAGRVIIRQKDPLPMNILAVLLNVDVEKDEN